MAEELLLGFVRTDRDGTSTDFAYSSAYEPEEIDDDEARIAIGTAEATLSDGEYQSSLVRAEPRSLALKWLLTDTTLTGLQAKLDALTRAHPMGAEGKLYRKVVEGATVLSNRYLPCRVAGRIKRSEEGLPYCRVTVLLRSGRPYWVEDSVTGTTIPRTQSLSSGGNAITPGGNEAVLPTFTFVVSDAGTDGYLTLTESVFGKSFRLTPPTTGTVTIDMDQVPPTARRSGDNVIGEISGELFALLPTAQTLTLTLVGGLTLSSASVAWRRRYSHA